MSSKSDTRTTRFPIPKTSEQVLDTVKALMTEGAVKLEFLFEEGIVRVTERVSGDLPFEEETSWDGALRNVENMEEYSSPGAESFQVVVDMMLLVAHRGCHAVQWATGVGGRALIEEWLELEVRGMPVECHHLGGVPLIELKSLPEETLVLCGSRYPDAGPEEISFAVKTTVELRSHDVQRGKVDDRRRNGPSEHAPTIEEMEAITTCLRLPKWNL